MLSIGSSLDYCEGGDNDSDNDTGLLYGSNLTAHSYLSHVHSILW